MLRFVVAWVAVSVFAPVALAQDKQTWEGPWVNKLYNSTGTMKCVGQKQKNGTWKATFSGSFQGRDFSYNVTFTAKPGKGQENLSGMARINNARYQWTGVMKGDTLSGQYRASNGYNGTFVLKSKK